MMRGLYLILSLLFLLLLTACSEQTRLPPVVELNWKAENSHQLTHKVKRGETLYTIAFHYDKDYRLLADYNHLKSPYLLHVGQIVYLQYLTQVPNRYYAPVQAVKAVSLKATLVNKQSVYSRKSVSYASPFVKHVNTGYWVWPAKGRVVANFIPQQGKKGIDIAGKKGEAVRAAASGVVAYSGSGLSGYGNLIIIKHDGPFLTAYGNNFRNHVVEGQQVKVGQIIAEMGMIDRKFWGVHFEIRKAGQPVNPMSYLKHR